MWGSGKDLPKQKQKQIRKVDVAKMRLLASNVITFDPTTAHKSEVKSPNGAAPQLGRSNYVFGIH
jgi:hypothetical protein